MTKRIAALFLVVAAAAPLGRAAAADANLPVPVQQYEGIEYYSAGVSIEERRALPVLYPLRVVFATDRGNLLCGAEVTISTGGRAIFRGTAANGPWLIVDVPPGTYDVEAIQDGTARTASAVRVAAGKTRTVLLRWKTTDVDMGL